VSDGQVVAALRPVRRPWEQVYDQLRALIVSGEMPRGERLPAEAALARGFGVSRRIVDEAMRALAHDGLIGPAEDDASAVVAMLPTIDQVAELMERNVGLLSQAAQVTLEQFMETRELIEVFAVREATRRRTLEDLELLRATTLDAGGVDGLHAQYVRNREFHRVLVDACRNPLLSIAAQPIFSVLHTNIVRSGLSADFSETICKDHRVILDAIESGSAEQAEAEMRTHLEYLSGVYREIWLHGPSGVASSR
jgi:DNA-binding FadR family transcriptional regulator